MARMSYIQWNDDDVRFVQDQHAKLNLYKASSQKQQFGGRHVAPLRHIMLILSQPVLALTPWSCMVSREAANTNFIISDLTPIGLKSKIYCTQGRKLTITPLMQFHLRKSPWEMYNEFDWFCIWNCHFKKHRGAIHLII